MPTKTAKKCHVSFHTPGHSGEAYKERGIFDYDITELSYSDNLLSPTGNILNLCNDWAKMYEVDFARIVTAGATSAIVAALMVLEGTPIIIGDCHLSIYNTLKRKCSKTIVVKDYIEAQNYLKRNKADYIIFTYPDYLGKDNGIEKVYELKQQYSLPLFIDSSHGSHFHFSTKLPNAATKYGDLVAYSLHKTLPVCTGGALICGNKKYEDKIGVTLRTTHTTSPSFMIIESIRWAVEQLEHAEYNYDVVLSTIEFFIKDLSKDNRYTVAANQDKTRLVINTVGDNYKVATLLEEYGIYVEGACEDGLILIVTPYNAKYLSYLAIALKELEDLGQKKQPLKRSNTLRVLDFKNNDFEVVDLDKSEDRIVYGEIGVYPPATPIYFYGDVLTKDDIKKLKDMDNIFGLEKGKVVVLK